MTDGRLSERGSAVVAAVLVSACFALLASQVSRTSRSAIVSANAASIHARLAAAADAGLAMAVAGLDAEPTSRWPLDGQAHVEDFADATLTIVVEDERGKVPLNTLTETQVRALFQRAGADTAAADALTEAFLDWRDPNRVRRGGAARPNPAPAARNSGGGFRTIEELALLPGMTPDLYAVLAPAVTVSSGDTAFEPRTAGALALEVMSEGGANSPTMIEKLRELAGQRTALDTEPPLDPVGRALTIRVAANDGRGGHVEQATIVELTSLPQRPYVVALRAE